VHQSSPTLHTGVRVFGSAIAVVLALIFVFERLAPGPPFHAPRAPRHTQLALTMLTVALGFEQGGLSSRWRRKRW
jgi:hypothetical protein